jgi:G3E family GTPase
LPLRDNFEDIAGLSKLAAMSSIPFHIISGFLGSGKTTFLLEILSMAPAGLRIGIIQNEFAPAHIDGAVLRESHRDFNLLELNNGSVFCVCLLGDFVKSLNSFIDSCQPSLLILEASGLADTTSVAEILSQPPLNQKLFLAANWCIVDALNFGKAGKLQQRVLQQIRMADLLVLNKTDLTGQGLPGVIETITQLNPFAPLMQTTYCKVPFFEVDIPAKPVFRMAAEPQGRPDIRSMVIKTTRRIGQENLLAFLRLWSPRAFRIKGFVVLDDGSSVSVQCTAGNVGVKPAQGRQGPTELIALTDEFTLPEWNRSFRHLVN